MASNDDRSSHTPLRSVFDYVEALRQQAQGYRMRACLAIVLLLSSVPTWATDAPRAAPRLLDAKDLPTEIGLVELQRQYDALRGMSLETIDYSQRGPVARIIGETRLTVPASARELGQGANATALLAVVSDLLLANGDESLEVHTNVLVDSERWLKLSQSINGIPVLNGQVSFAIDDATLQVLGVSAYFVPNRGLPRSPKLTAQEAERVVPETPGALDKNSSKEIEIIEGTYLAYYENPAESVPAQLVWVVRTQSGGRQVLFFVDAITGVIAAREKATHEITHHMPCL